MDLGFYGTFGLGSANWSVDSTDTTNTWSIHKRHEHTGFGFVLDDYPNKDLDLNYHLNVGYHRFGRFSGLMASNAFGYHKYLTPTTRFRVGPEIRLDLVNGYEHAGLYNGLGIGPVAGLSWDVGSIFSFGIVTGYQYLSYDNRWYWNAGHRRTERLFYINVEMLFKTKKHRRYYEPLI